MKDPLFEFRDILKNSGLTFIGDFITDGKLHRFRAEGDSSAASWYVLHLTDSFCAGAFGCWKRNLSEKWNNANGNATQLTREQWIDIKNRMSAAEAARRTEEEQLRYEAKTKAQAILSAAKPVEEHLYLLRKSVSAYGEMRVNDKNELCLPLRDEKGVLHSMQFIAPDKRYTNNRDKDFVFGGKVQGCFYTVSDRTDGPLVICEGYATGASIFDATGYATVCAMFCGNLLAVAQALRKKYPERDFIFAADNDRFTAANPGVEKATEAAKTIKATVAIPEFSDQDNDGTDFNDLAELSGAKAVRQTIEVAYKDFLMPKFAALPTPRNAAEMWADTSLIPPKLLIVDVLHKGLKMVIGSGSKAYKSWILWDIAVSVASGKQFWQFGTNQGKVLVLNFEIPDWSMKGRLVEIARAKGVGADALKNIDVWCLRGYATELFKILPDLLRQIKYGGYDLVILDPIYKVLGGMDENAAGDIAKMCNDLEMICVQTGASILYAAHFSKGNQADKEAMDRIGGSGVFGRDPDAIITLTKHEEEDAYTVDVILRNLRRIEPFVMKLDFPLYVQAEGADPEDLKRPGKKTDTGDDQLEDVAQLLSAGSLRTTDWQKNAYGEGVPRATFYRIVKRLEAVNRVLRSEINGRWQLVTARQQPTAQEQQLMEAVQRAQEPDAPAESSPGNDSQDLL